MIQREFGDQGIAFNDPGPGRARRYAHMSFLKIDRYGRRAELRSVAPGRSETRLQRTVVTPVREYRSALTQSMPTPSCRR
jgi:hypothetical protein